MATQDGDPYVLNVQKWVNDTYRGKTGYTEIPENGKTGWTTIYALLHALQIELGITATADNFGNGTINAFNRDYPTGVHQQDDDDDKTKENIYGIIQGALLCKGYSIGASGPTCNFYGGTGDAVKKLKADAGLTDTTSTVTLNIMKALMSMDYFYSYDTSERTQNIIEMQRYLNRNYEDYTGLCPCDGIYARRTNKALIYAVQKEEKIDIDDSTGTVGNTTTACLPSIQINGQYSGTNAKGQSYTVSEITRFKVLANIALYFNGYGSGTISSDLDASVIRDFQTQYALPVNGNMDRTTFLSLLASCGDKERSAIACDCITKITSDNVEVLKNNGYQYIGRYLANYPGGTLDKELSTDEIKVILNNGIRLIPIQQGGARSLDYFTNDNANKEVSLGITAANKFKLQFGSIIYFAVDYDAQDAEIDNVIVPYFKEIEEAVMFYGKGRYRVGVYGPRNVCTKVCEAGYACSSYVSDMSTGYSGNLGFPIPDNWAFDQFATTDISSNGKSIEIDKVGYSGRYRGISQEYSIAEGDEYDKNTTTNSFILANCSGTSIPVYAAKKHINWPLPQSGTQYGVTGDIIGEIKPNDFYVFYGVTKPIGDNIHKVLFNDGVDVKMGFVEGQEIYPNAGDNENAANFNQRPKYSESYACFRYVPETNNYKLDQSGNDQIIKINKSVPYFDVNGYYKGMLKNGDKITITANNVNNTGASRPWCYRVSKISFKNGKVDTAPYYVSVGLEYGSNGAERAWY